MTLAARILGTADDLEETPVTTPQRRLPGANGIPYWRGVYGLDPECRTSDWRFAAQCVAMTLGVLVFGPDAGRRAAFRNPSSSPAGKLLAWLLQSADEVDARIRFLSLRLAAEQAHAGHVQAEPSRVIDAAEDYRAAVYPG